ncbi:MAG TPA: hypothetical protein PLV68_09880, partial [Ilumatobacteraceae bacterium]|nr:hypothetical protein [Ilumatobacteraceae bacterium]
GTLLLVGQGGLVLASTDPAQPYGATLSWPDRGERAGRAARAAGSSVVLAAGTPLAWFDRRSSHLVLFPAGHDDTRWAQALAGMVGEGIRRSIEVRKIDGEPIPATSPAADALRAAGFVDGYRGLTYRRS